ncbi:MAG: amidohydrolase family protein [Desulfosalsimonadaceae bacterium]
MGLLLLKNAQIVDGTGAAPFLGHLLVDGSRIAEVFHSDAQTPAAETVINASGLAVAPGFIDIHSHSDWALTLPDHALALKCLPEQGVTTIVGGNCGFSPAPLTEKSRRIMGGGLFNLMIDKPLSFTWSSYAAFFKTVENIRPIVNFANLTGHASLRFAAADTRRGAMGSHELSRCLALLEQTLEEGACGLSFGLGYDPGMYSPIPEIEAFIRTTGAAGKPVTVHAKALSRVSPTYSPLYPKPHNIRALRELLEIAHRTGIRLQISHLIFVGRRSWSTADKCLEMIEKEKQRGLDVLFDAFPYHCGNTTINAILPAWFLARVPEVFHNSWARARLRAELAIGFRLVGMTYKDIQVMDAGPPEWAWFNGMRMDELARHWQMTPFDATLKVSEVSGGNAVILLHTYSGEPGDEALLYRVLTNDSCLFMTDAFCRYKGYPNPAAMGTFPKLLGDCVRRRRLLPLETAVNRMTAASASRFHLRDRGLLAKGMAADIVMFDPDTIDETPPDGPNPARRPKGIQHVWINGSHVVQQGHYVEGVRAGQVIRT